MRFSWGKTSGICHHSTIQKKIRKYIAEKPKTVRLLALHKLSDERVYLYAGMSIVSQLIKNADFFIIEILLFVKK